MKLTNEFLNSVGFKPTSYGDTRLKHSLFISLDIKNKIKQKMVLIMRTIFFAALVQLRWPTPAPHPSTIHFIS